MYCRKSTDSEDRQVQSIDDQKHELEKLARERGVSAIKILDESQSAKKPGRPVFNQMIQAIRDGEADGILCWKINRLTRNPIDGAQIQWFLQQGIIKSILTPGREYKSEDNVMMMSVELGMANQFILDLSKDVRRGLDSKVEKGWRPGYAPLGYRNDRHGEQGNKQIYTDEDTFPLVRKMWDLILTNSYTMSEIARIAHSKWGLRGRRGKTLAVGTVHKIFNNPFYYGEFSWKGEVYQGKHQPMITIVEFDRAQRILGVKGQPRPKYKHLPFNGVIHCGECEGMITSEEKFKQIKSTGGEHRYIYHRCTRRKKDRPCHQKPIRHEDLKAQIEQYLESITIPPEFLHWAIEVLRDNNKLEESNRTKILANQRRNYDTLLKRIDNLINLYISPENADRGLLSEDEYKTQKNALVREKAIIEAETRRVEGSVDDWLELTEQTFNFATYAHVWFEQGDFEAKTRILQALGSNFVFKDGILNIQLQEPLLTLKNGLASEPLKTARLEPEFLREDKTKDRRLAEVFSQWSGIRESNPLP